MATKQETEFEKLPKQVQCLRWKLFELTNGYAKDPWKSNSFKLVRNTMNLLHELKEAGDTLDRDGFLKLYDRFLMLQTKERKAGRLKN